MMKKISVMVADEEAGGINVNGAIIGPTKRMTAYQLDENGPIIYDRNEAKERDRQRNLRVALHEALNFDNFHIHSLSPKEFLDLFLSHETRIRNIMASKKLRRFQFRNTKTAKAA